MRKLSFRSGSPRGNSLKKAENARQSKENARQSKENALKVQTLMAEQKAAKIAASEAEIALQLAMAASKLQNRVRMKRAQQRKAHLQNAQADQAAGAWKEGTQKEALEDFFEAAGGVRCDAKKKKHRDEFDFPHRI